MPKKKRTLEWVPADWLGATVMLSPAARGIWIDILCAMYQNDRADTLSGTLPELARAGRCDVNQLRTCVGELSKFGVAEVTKKSQDGDEIVTITCRRFQKANAERLRVRERMRVTRELRKSDGNVNSSLRQCDGNVTPRKKREKNPPRTPPFKRETENVSSVPARAEGFDDPDFGSLIPEALRTPAFLDKWEEWLRYRRAKRQTVSRIAAARQLSKLGEIGEEAAIWTIERSIENDWQGLFPPRALPVKIGKDESGI